MVPALATVATVAERLALDETTVRRLCRRGELVVYRLGAALRVDLGSVEEYLCRTRQHVPRSVPEATSGDLTSTAAGRPGTRAGAPSVARASRSTRRSGPTPSAGSASSSEATDPWEALRAKHRNEPSST